MLSRLFIIALLLPAGTLLAQQLSESSPAPTTTTSIDTPHLGSWGFDLTGMDRSVKPGDDFVEYTVGNWKKRTEIPPDRSRYGAFDALGELSDLRVRILLEDLRRTATTLPSQASPEQSDRVKLAGLFSSFLNQAEADRKDAAPIQPRLAAIRAITTPRDLAILMGKFDETFAGGGTLFGIDIEQDEKNPGYYTLYLYQSGLGLPDREYYLDEIYASQKQRYQQYIAQMLEMIAWENPKESAEKIVDFETKIAAAHWTRGENRNRDKTYNRMTIPELIDMAPGFDWQAMLDASGVGQSAQIIVTQNTAMPKMAKIFADTPISTLQAWSAFKTADDAAPLLSTRFFDAHFDFHGRFMSGAPEPRSREKRAASFTERAMGEAVGREYVAKYFPPKAKAAAEELVANVKSAMRARIEHLAWMSAPTKEKALAKMSKFTVKIGYPPKWRDYSMLFVDPNDRFANADRAKHFEHAYWVAKLGQEVDRMRWDMTPQTVNAYYSSEMNEIVFPAAILQPPFFDASADPAVNYGGIGAVIGHEITHGFDDQGRKSNGDGMLTDWWTPDDSKRFEAEAKKLGVRYEAYAFPTVPGSHINAKATMGENIADLGGILNGLDAYHLSLHGQSAPILDGFTGDQRVFLGWAQAWRNLTRDAALKQQLATDPHSPGNIRAFAPLRNVDAWYDAFDIKPTDKLYLAPDQRVHIW